MAAHSCRTRSAGNADGRSDREDWQVIHEVDDVLRLWVVDEILTGTDVEVAFDAPTSEWAARRNAPTVNLFLYDIREDLTRRSQGLIAEHDEQGVVVARHDPPRWFKLSYLVTAWTNRPQDEHRLLSALLAGFLRREVLPKDRLAGSLAELGLSMPVTVGLPPGEVRTLADVWSALGGELKPSLDVVISTPVVTGQQVQAEKPPTSRRAVVKAKRPGDSWWPTTGKEKEPAEGRLAEAEPGATERRRPPWVAEERSRRWDPQGREGQPRPPAGSGQPRPDGSARKGRHRGDR
jgi:Pvc16 N-terminal domain